ncbi:hypothetical protein [Bifidobacterium eulemuris]|uniref:Uncharacterized protein n=1 Tax=Bifidobacterium eulemuris TaxID=1765219 RepID=A0A261GDV6_9BIFI|nr:hypothetical protein [Bifidobacterium eulemuris]OZG69639.1 hypothetical protein BEUL_0056 [Bifidobacterium eulemuris]QOL32247.1 hypothetical protein BE0216_07110 [Bifidobacterium eulemuris]
MTATDAAQIIRDDAFDADYADKILRFNLRILMGASGEGKNQSYFAKLFGITTAGMSQKLSKPGRLTYQEVLIIAHELHTTVAALSDDTLYRQTQAMYAQIEGLSDDIQRMTSSKIAEWKGEKQKASGTEAPEAMVPPVGFEPTTHEFGV